MTTVELPPLAQPGPPTATGLITSRGETIIAPRVVEKIATRAASEVEGVGGVTQAGLSRLLPWTTGTGSPAQATAELGEGTVQLQLTVNVVYPQPVATVTNAVRATVSQRLAELCRLTATQIDITVPALVVASPSTRRRVE